MPTMYNITLKDGADAAQLEKYASQSSLYPSRPHPRKPFAEQKLTHLYRVSRAKATAKEQGGQINHEFKLIKGFTVEFPNDAVHTMKTDEHIHVEQDGEARTQ
ncbi:hypothetical protein MMC21_006299 [Puttea exsequens]|nr:hypothetical protein [Puttea exsequens]